MVENVDDIRKRVQKAQMNYNENLEIIDGILIKERGYAFRKPVDEDVLMLCSGGLDSTVAMDVVINEWNSVIHPIFFRRGARAEKFEEEAFDFFVDFYREMYPKNIADAIKVECYIPSKEIKQHIPQSMVLTVGHPLRNSTMQNRAVEYAVGLNSKLDLNIKTILTGSVGEDKSEPELGTLSLRAQTLNTCVNMGDWDWQITSALTEPTLENRPVYKIGLIRYANEKGIPLEKTRTCFSEYKVADGTCFACVKRLRAFDYLGIEDPLPYRSRQKK